MQVVLQPRDQAALATFVQGVSTPGSPSYHHYLAARRLRAAFGPAASTVSAVEAALRKGGLTVGEPRDRRPVDTGHRHRRSVRTRAVDLLHDLSHAGPARRVANSTPAKLVASIASQVAGIVGLDQLTQRGQPPASVGASATALLATHCTLPAATTRRRAHRAVGRRGPAACSGSGRHGQRDRLLHRPPRSPTTTASTRSTAGGDLGQGVTIGVVELEPYPASDVAAYQACFGTHTAGVGGGRSHGGSTDDSDISEAALDVEDLIGLAPSSKSGRVRRRPTTPPASTATTSSIADADTAKVISDSWGLCEAEPGVADLAVAERPLFQQMAAQGQSVLAATGDTGSEGCYSPPDSTDDSLSVWDPASQPEVTAVGGTTLDHRHECRHQLVRRLRRQRRRHLHAVDDARLPAHRRHHRDSKAAPCGSNAVPCRETPDVSASADVDHGYLAYFNGQWHAVGGTSAATPTWAALISLIDASCDTGPVGFLNPALYELAAASSAALVDVNDRARQRFHRHPGRRLPAAGGLRPDHRTRPTRPPFRSIRRCAPASPRAAAGSATVTPTAVTVGASSTLTFNYMPPTGKGLINGEIDLTVPGTWSAPSTLPTDPGYVTSTDGTVRVDGAAIQVRGITVARQPAGHHRLRRHRARAARERSRPHRTGVDVLQQRPLDVEWRRVAHRRSTRRSGSSRSTATARVR